MSKLFMLVGLPGSGKSTYAEELAIRENAFIYSTDKYREMLGEGETDQMVNAQVFQKLPRDISDALAAGQNCIYDATNLVSKQRRNFLQGLPDCEKICILIMTPFEECLKNNDGRDRVVPPEVITKMYKRFETPYMEEGWDNIIVETKQAYDLETYLHTVINFDQHNSHHTDTLGVHSIKVAEHLCDDLYIAGLLHDCGKPFCQTFYNTKNELSEEAHYYCHENTGAYDIFFFGLENPLLISWLVNNHMRPYQWKSQKLADKYCNYWGFRKFNMLMQLHQADEDAK